MRIVLFTIPTGYQARSQLSDTRFALSGALT